MCVQHLGERSIAVISLNTIVNSKDRSHTESNDVNYCSERYLNAYLG